MSLSGVTNALLTFMILTLCHYFPEIYQNITKSLISVLSTCVVINLLEEAFNTINVELNYGTNTVSFYRNGGFLGPLTVTSIPQFEGIECGDFSSQDAGQMAWDNFFLGGIA